MTPDRNPYLPPAEDAPPPLRPPHQRALDEASTGQRLLTLFVDYLAVVALATIALTFRVRQPGEAQDNANDYAELLGVVFLFGYYLLCEATTGRTLGKLVSGTKVVSERGGVPTFGQIAARTAARLVPFEPLSFIFSNSGWHDRWSATRVVRVRDGKR